MKVKKPRIFLVTGAASGIGAAFARLAIEQGHQVMLADINLRGAKAMAAPLGDRACSVALDIRSPQAWEQALDATEQRFGPLDVLVNNAAIVHTGNARDVSIELHQHTMDTNFMGPVTGMLATMRRFREQGHGHMVTVCSMTAFLPFPGIASYGASKHALRAFHHALALEERRGPIDFTIVHPTSTQTPMLEQEKNDDATALAFASEPVTPEFVAETIMRAVKRKALEVFMPPEQARAVRLLGTDAKKLRGLIDQMEMIGRDAQLAARQATSA
ncbi:SDR family oxidoreductase [Variovorax sp. AFSI2.2]|uniref:SDR family oxidoreductase n=1 Tax=Variovorax sp. AFSI2.2 TaxID=3384160 RepID=UPI003EB7898D